MSKLTPVALAAVVGLAAAGPALAAPESPLVGVTNTQTERVAYCTVLVDGRARTQLAIRPGKTWSDAFDPRRQVLLVCERATSLRFGPLRAGVDYRLTDVGHAKIALTEGGQ